MALSSAAPQESRLDKMGREVTERAAKDIKSKDAEKRLSAVESLSSWKRPEGAALLVQGLSDVDERVRAASARSLGTYDKEAEPARQALMKALDDPRPSVVAQAAEALEKALKVGEKELGRARMRVLEEGGLTDRFLAARSLVGQAPASRLVDPILDYIEGQFQGLASSDYKTRDASRNNVEIGETALQRLVKDTRDRSLLKALRVAAVDFRQRNDIPLKAMALFDPRPEGWAKLLVEQLASPDPKVLGEVLFLMGRTASSAGDVATWAPEAARFEKHPDPSIRRAIVYALGEARGLASDQIDVAVRALGEADKSLRENAAEAIGEIGDRNQATPAAGKKLVAERAAAALRAASEKDPDAGVRDKAARALLRLQTGPSGAAPAPASSRAAQGERPKSPAGNAQGEADALAVLRSKKRAFDVNSFFGALTERDPAVVQAYLDAGMDPNGRADKDGDSPLSFLFRAGACSPVQRPTPAAVKEILKTLLARGADPKLADAQMNTPLMAAAMGGCDRETIALLVKAGARVDAKNSAGLTAFEMGLFSGHDGLEELIAAGYRLPADKAALYRQGYAANPRSLDLIGKATAPAKK
ncbi:MAG: HEAT repeat domain-containing protein [Vicinamibacteria bacterium]|nr:HEAT repeat domain-containing protein [Vicinamibacteria bacterium]